MKNQECKCLSNNKVKPNETCLFCCHKHLAAALALTNEYYLNDELLPRIASQIQLAAWHFDINYVDYVKKCKSIIDKIFSFIPFKEDLINLTESTWELYNNNKNITHIYNNTNLENIDANKKDNFKNGLLCISNAIELYEYEKSYKDVNLSYIIGQLSLASWYFQEVNQNYSLLIRSFYNEIKNEKFKINEIIDLRNFLWKKFKQDISKFAKENFNP